MTRAVRTLVTLVVLVLVLVVGAVVGWQQLTQPFPGPGAGESGPCRETGVEAGARVTPAMLTVSVYNAGTRSGLADRTMNDLVDRGFGAGDTGNMNLDRPLRRAEVWVAERGDRVGALVASYLGRKVPVRARRSEGPGVTVVVGNRFAGVRKGRKGVEAARDTVVCTPIDDGDELAE